MILKRFREYSIKKYLNKTLSNRKVYVDNSKAKSLGILFNIDEYDDYESFRQLGDFLRMRQDQLKIVAFSPTQTDKPNFWEICFNPKDIGWKGNIKNIELESFLNKEFDVLISYYTSDELELKFLTGVSSAKFKIGILQSDSRINDLIINTDLKEFKVFKNEVFKYLNILNKI